MEELKGLKQFNEPIKVGKEGAEAAKKEAEEKKEGTQDLYKQLITLATKLDHHLAMYLSACYADCGMIIDYRVADAYKDHLYTIVSFLRILEKVGGEARDLIVKETIVKLRLIMVEAKKNLIKPLVDKLNEPGAPQSKTYDTFRKEWNARVVEFQKIADQIYERLDTRSLLVV